MNTTIYVLLMVIAGSDPRGGYVAIQQEFTTPARCEAARVALAQAHSRFTLVKAQGCFPK